MQDMDSPARGTELPACGPFPTPWALLVTGAFLLPSAPASLECRDSSQVPRQPGARQFNPFLALGISSGVSAGGAGREAQGRGRSQRPLRFPRQTLRRRSRPGGGIAASSCRRLAAVPRRQGGLRSRRGAGQLESDRGDGKCQDQGPCCAVRLGVPGSPSQPDSRSGRPRKAQVPGQETPRAAPRGAAQEGSGGARGRRGPGAGEIPGGAAQERSRGARGTDLAVPGRQLLPGACWQRPPPGS
ncbi:unnamed protein product [Natator depressus]